MLYQVEQFTREPRFALPRAHSSALHEPRTDKQELVAEVNNMAVVQQVNN